MKVNKVKLQKALRVLFDKQRVLVDVGPVDVTILPLSEVFAVRVLDCEPDGKDDVGTFKVDLRALVRLANEQEVELRVEGGKLIGNGKVLSEEAAERNLWYPVNAKFSVGPIQMDRLKLAFRFAHRNFNNATSFPMILREDGKAFIVSTDLHNMVILDAAHFGQGAGNYTLNADVLMDFVRWIRQGTVVFVDDVANVVNEDVPALVRVYPHEGMGPWAEKVSRFAQKYLDVEPNMRVTVPEGYTPRKMMFITPEGGVLFGVPRGEFAVVPFGMVDAIASIAPHRILGVTYPEQKKAPVVFHVDGAKLIVAQIDL